MCTIASSIPHSWAWWRSSCCVVAPYRSVVIKYHEKKNCVRCRTRETEKETEIEKRKKNVINTIMETIAMAATSTPQMVIKKNQLKYFPEAHIERYLMLNFTPCFHFALFSPCPSLVWSARLLLDIRVSYNQWLSKKKVPRFVFRTDDQDDDNDVVHDDMK